MLCAYCREEIDDEATVCPHCGAYAKVDRDGELSWYRRGDHAPAVRAVGRWVVLALVLVLGAVVVWVAAVVSGR